MISTTMVFIDGTVHAMVWKICDLLSMASWPHLRPAERNQVTVSITHQMDPAIRKKYMAMAVRVQRQS